MARDTAEKKAAERRRERKESGSSGRKAGTPRNFGYRNFNPEAPWETDSRSGRNLEEARNKALLYAAGFPEVRARGRNAPAPSRFGWGSSIESDYQESMRWLFGDDRRTQADRRPYGMGKGQQRFEPRSFEIEGGRMSQRAADYLLDKQAILDSTPYVTKKSTAPAGAASRAEQPPSEPSEPRPKARPKVPPGAGRMDRRPSYPLVSPEDIGYYRQEFPYFTEDEIRNALQGRNPELLSVLRNEQYRQPVPDTGSGRDSTPNPAMAPLNAIAEGLRMSLEGLDMIGDRTWDAGRRVFRLLSGPPIWEVVGDGEPFTPSPTRQALIDELLGRNYRD